MGKTPAKMPLLAAGAGAVVLGLGLLVWGLAPVTGFGPAMEVFGGGSPPEDLGEQISATMDRLGDRVWADGLGAVLILGGIIIFSMGKPREKTVEEQVEEAVEARLAGLAASPAAPAPATQAAPAPPVPSAAPLPPAPVAPAAVPAPAAPAPAPTPGLPRCATCGTIKIAGGRICPRCG